MPFLCFAEGFLVGMCFLGLGLEEFYQFSQSFLNPFCCLFFFFFNLWDWSQFANMCLFIDIYCFTFADVHGMILDPYHK